MTRAPLDDKKLFWDPLTGRAFATDDVKCPLTNIGILVTIDVSSTTLLLFATFIFPIS